MKKNVLILFFLVFVSFIAMSQNSIINYDFGKQAYFPVTIELNNGEVLLGEIVKINSPRIIEIASNNFEPRDIEDHENVANSSIIFRKSENENSIKIPVESVNYITFFDKELNSTKEFKRLNIVRTKNNGEIEITNKIVFFELIKKGDINLYGYNIVLKTGNKYLRSVFYLNNSKDNYAINPLDFNFFDLFKSNEKINNEVINAFKFVTKNCPKFSELLDKKIDFTEEMKKNMIQDYKKLEEEIKEGKKNYKKSSEKNEYELNMYCNFFISPFLKFIKKYEETCR